MAVPAADAQPAGAPAAPPVAPPAAQDAAAAASDAPLLTLLAGLAREALRHEPADLVAFARSYFADLDAARSPPAAADAAAPASLAGWSPALDAAAADAPAAPALTAAATPPCDDDDASGALAAILSVGRARAGGEGEDGRGGGRPPLASAFTAPPEVGDLLARVAVGDI